MEARAFKNMTTEDLRRQLVEYQLGDKELTVEYSCGRHRSKIQKALAEDFYRTSGCPNFVQDCLHSIQTNDEIHTTYGCDFMAYLTHEFKKWYDVQTGRFIPQTRPGYCCCGAKF